MKRINPIVGDPNSKVMRHPMIKSCLLPLGVSAYKCWPKPDRRRFNAFCVGLPRSGTQSIHAIFSENAASAHEPVTRWTLHFLLEHLISGTATSNKKLKDVFLARDKYLRLELESAHYLYLVVPLLVELFPESKFILTIRDPYTWLRSEINQELRTEGLDSFSSLAAFKYGKYGTRRPEAEKVLGDSPRLYPISSYLQYWSEHINTVVNSVPSDRLFVVRTCELRDEADSLARFLGLTPADVDTAKTHSHKAKGYAVDPLALMPAGYVQNLVEQHCQPWFDKYWP